MKLPNSHSGAILKNSFLKILAFFFLLSGSLKSQAFFNLSPTLCATSTVNVNAQFGNLAATAYTWSSAPSGPMFSTPNASVCDISFPSAGTYSIQLTISDGTTTSSTIRVIIVYPLPILTLNSSASPICVNDGATLTATGADSYIWNPSGALYFLSSLHDEAYATPPVTTGYTVVGSSSVGCQSSVSFTQIVNPYPQLVISANTTTVCQGFYATLTALGASNYAWTGTGITTPVSQSTISVGAGTYSLAGAIGNCFDYASLTIDLAAPLNLSLTASRSSICKDDNDSIIPVILQATGASGFSWKPYLPGRMTFSIGASTAVSPSVTTCFTVTGSDAFCSGTASICLDIISCTGIDEKQSKNNLHVYPNPTNDKLFISTATSDETLITLTTLTGETTRCYQSVFNKETLMISLRELPTGIYFLSVEVKGQSPQQVRVVKQ